MSKKSVTHKKRIQKFQLFNKINFVFRKELNLKLSPLLHISVQGDFFLSLTVLIKQFKNRHFFLKKLLNKYNNFVHSFLNAFGAKTTRSSLSRLIIKAQITSFFFLKKYLSDSIPSTKFNSIIRYVCTDNTNVLSVVSSNNSSSNVYRLKR